MKKVKRKSFRFRAAPSTIVQVSFAPTKGEFKTGLVGLALDESPKGASFACSADRRLGVGKSIYVKIGRLAAVRAEVRWKRELDLGLMAFGLEFFTG